MKSRKKIKENGFLFYNDIIITSKNYLKCCTLISEELALYYLNNKSKNI